MKVSRTIAAAALGVMMLPFLFVDAQQPRKESRIAQLMAKAEEPFWKRGTLEEKHAALEELDIAFERINSTVMTLSVHGLRDEDDQIRVKSARVLAKMGPTAALFGSAVRELIKVLETDKVPEVRKEAATALGNILWMGSTRPHTKDAVLALIKAMKRDEDTHVRWSACYAFRLIGPSAWQAAPDLLELMKEKNDTRMAQLASNSFQSVVSPENKGLVPVLLKVYRDEKQDLQIKNVALGALGKIGHEEDIVVPILVDALKLPERRGVAAAGLTYMGPKAKAAVPALVAALDVSGYKDRDHAYLVLSRVCRALEAIGPDARAALPTLRKMAASSDLEARFQSIVERTVEELEQKPHR
jgi:HEAT repeat protein